MGKVSQRLEEHLAGVCPASESGAQAPHAHQVLPISEPGASAPCERRKVPRETKVKPEDKENMVANSGGRRGKREPSGDLRHVHALPKHEFTCTRACVQVRTSVLSSLPHRPMHSHAYRCEAAYIHVQLKESRAKRYWIAIAWFRAVPAPFVRTFCWCLFRALASMACFL